MGRWNNISVSVGLTFAEVAFVKLVLPPVHSLHVADLPCLTRFFCDLENSVCSAVFPHLEQRTAASAEDAARAVSAARAAFPAWYA